MTTNIDTKGRVIYMLEKNSRMMEKLAERKNQSTRAPTHVFLYIQYPKSYAFLEQLTLYFHIHLSLNQVLLMTTNIDTKGRVIYMLEKKSRMMEKLVERKNQSTRAPTHWRQTHEGYTCRLHRRFYVWTGHHQGGMHKIGMWSLEGFGVQLK